eukprot:scaffold2143_cov33-Phaeocystis_antarctica.AAC.1
MGPDRYIPMHPLGKASVYVLPEVRECVSSSLPGYLWLSISICPLFLEMRCRRVLRGIGSVDGARASVPGLGITSRNPNSPGRSPPQIQLPFGALYFERNTIPPQFHAHFSPQSGHLAVQPAHRAARTRDHARVPRRATGQRLEMTPSRIAPCPHHCSPASTAMSRQCGRTTVRAPRNSPDVDRSAGCVESSSRSEQPAHPE